MTITVTHNPYTVSTEITVDGREPSPGTDYVQRTRGNRLSSWIDDFFRLIYDKFCREDIFFVFRGIAQDAEDFRQALDRFNTSGKQKHRFQAEIKISEIGSRPLEALAELYDEGKNGPYADLFNSEVMKQAFERATSREFEVNVIATMSSGKSTLLNALIGQNFIPSKQEACTATIARIEDCKGMKEFTAVRYDQNDKCLNETPEPVSRKLLKEWNEDQNTSIIEIKGDIQTLDQTNDSRYIFIDTPGPNNSRNQRHKEITLTAIKSKPLSMVLYVLDGGKFGINDDLFLLREVADAMKAGDRQAQDRFIFVQNKLDDVDLKEDSVEGMIENAKKYLQENGILNPTIIPVSAKLAKLLRIRKFRGTLSVDEQEELKMLKDRFLRKGNEALNLFEHARKMVNPRIVRKLEKRLEHASDDERAEIYSGVPVLEELLNDFLCRHAIPAKTKDAVDSMSRIAQEDHEKKDYLKIISDNEKEIERYQKIIEGFVKDEANLKKADTFIKEIDAINYTRSPQTTQTINDINEKKLALLDILKCKLSGEVNVARADKLCDDANAQCANFDTSIRTTLKEAFKKECVFQMDTLRRKYEDYINNILRETIKDKTIRDFLGVTLKLPDTKILIEENRENKPKPVQVERSNWHPLKWLSWLPGCKGLKYTTELRDNYVVEMELIYNGFYTSVIDYSTQTLAEFETDTKAALKDYKKDFKEIMKTNQGKLETIAKKMEEAIKNKKELEKQRTDLNEKIKWYESFRKKLNVILDI